MFNNVLLCVMSYASRHLQNELLAMRYLAKENIWQDPVLFPETLTHIKTVIN